jgi:RNA polymerase sigma factor (sigma-70 family)
MDRNIPRVATEPEASWDGKGGLEQLYRRYAPWLGAMLRKRFGHGFDAEADDVVQETYARLAPHDTATIKRPQAYLMRVASNLALDHLRRRAVRGRHAKQEASLAPLESAATPADLLRIKEAILSMPQSYLDVFVLRRFHGLSYEEIATRSGLSIKTIEWRLARASAHCVKYLKADGEEHR